VWLNIPPPPAVIELSSRGAVGIHPTAPLVTPSIPVLAPRPSRTPSATNTLQTARVNAVDRRRVVVSEGASPSSKESKFSGPSSLPAEPQDSDSPEKHEPITEPVTSSVPVAPQWAGNEAPGENAPPEITGAMDKRIELPSGPTDVQLIERTLQRYAAAISARDAEALSQVVFMDVAARGRQPFELGKYDSLSMALRVIQEPEIVGAKATVRCSTEERIGMPGRPQYGRTSKVRITLEKNDGHWMVRDVHELR
jgi:hypothetical protein